MTVEEIWEKLWIPNCSQVGVERTDRLDPYCYECNFSLDVDGYEFGGYGTDSCGNHEIEYLECRCPDGTVIRII